MSLSQLTTARRSTKRFCVLRCLRSTTHTALRPALSTTCMTRTKVVWCKLIDYQSSTTQWTSESQMILLSRRIALRLQLMYHPLVAMAVASLAQVARAPLRRSSLRLFPKPFLTLTRMCASRLTAASKKKTSYPRRIRSSARSPSNHTRSSMPQCSRMTST